MQHTAPDLPSLLRRLERPTGPVDVVLDTDTYNEVDDQFALSYLLASQEQLSLKALYAAPFFNENSTGPADGMEKSYAEGVTDEFVVPVVCDKDGTISDNGFPGLPELSSQ